MTTEHEEEVESVDTSPIRYSSISRRIEASIIDSLVILALFVGGALLIGHLEVQLIYARIAIFVAPFLLYEPLLISLSGKTVGYFLRSQRVVRKIDGSRLSYPQAVIRFFFKGVFGIFSLVFMLATRKHQALHDLMVDSVVLVDSDNALYAPGALPEREIDESTPGFPSKIRRGSVIAIYIVVSYLVLGTVLLLFESSACIDYNICTEKDNILEKVVGGCGLLALCYIVPQGWRGRLFGCRRQRFRPESDEV